ncbi:16798_t:CDS:1, partial [Acaulospora morrowiae]
RFSSNEISTKEATTPKSKKPTSKTPTQEPTESVPDMKELESNNSAKKGGFKRLGKTLFGITLLAGLSYGGAVYYSLKNEDFRSLFTKTVYGAEEAVEYVEDIHKQGTFNQIENGIIKWRDYAYEKIPGIKSSTPSENPSTSEESVDIVSVASPPKETSMTQINKEEKVSKGLISTEETIVSKLAYTLNELDAILRNYDVKDEGESILKKAREELNELNNRVEVLKIEAQNAPEKSTSELTKKFNETLANYEKNVDDYIMKKEASMNQKFKQEKQQVYEEYYEKLNAQLKKQAEEYDKELKNELVRQAVQLQRRWIGEVRSLVERERGGRLGRLDAINHRLKVLERLS